MRERDVAILELEGKWFKHAGSKLDAILALGMSETRYYQRLAVLVGVPAAWEHSPHVMRRVQGRLVRSRSGARRVG